MIKEMDSLPWHLVLVGIIKARTANVTQHVANDRQVTKIIIFVIDSTSFIVER